MDYKRLYYNWIINSNPDILHDLYVDNEYAIKILNIEYKKNNYIDDKKLIDIFNSSDNVNVCSEILEILQSAGIDLQPYISKIINMYSDSDYSVKSQIIKLSSKYIIIPGAFNIYKQWFNKPSGIDIHNIPIVFEAIDKYNWSDINECINIFNILINLAYYDIILPKHFKTAVKIYYDTDNYNLRTEIMLYISNVYRDDLYKNQVYDIYMDLVENYLLNYYSRNPEEVSELFFDIDHPSEKMLDVFIDYLDTCKNFLINSSSVSKCISAFSKRLTEDNIKYILNHGSFKYFANNIVLVSHTNYLRYYIQIFSYWTYYSIGSQFFYKLFLKNNNINISIQDTSYIFFAISNIITEPLDTIDNEVLIEHITKYLSRCNNIEFIYFITSNISNDSLGKLLNNSLFIHEFSRWLFRHSSYIDHNMKNILSRIFIYIGENPEYHYLYRQLPICQQNLYPIIEKYLHYTLAQKCAILLYNRKNISMADLNILDVQIFENI